MAILANIRTILGFVIIGFLFASQTAAKQDAIFLKVDDTPASQIKRLDEVHGAWVVTCLPIADKRECAARQFQTDAANGKQLLMAEFHFSSDGAVRGGVLLSSELRKEDGVQVALDGKGSNQKLPLTNCSEKGCAVMLAFTGAALDKVLTGKQLELSATQPDGTAKTFVIPLNGFSDAGEKIKALAKSSQM